MSSDDESSAGRLAAVLLMLGLVILVVSLGVLSFGERGQAAGAAAEAPSELDRDAVQLTWVRAMFWLALLIFFFVLALTAFLRWSQHFRHRLLRKSSAPTSYSDAWSQYRLPPDYDNLENADDLDDDDDDDDDANDLDETDDDR